MLNVVNAESRGPLKLSRILQTDQSQSINIKLARCCIAAKRKLFYKRDKLFGVDVDYYLSDSLRSSVSSSTFKILNNFLCRKLSLQFYKLLKNFLRSLFSYAAAYREQDF
jgi:hypothetical protein